MLITLIAGFLTGYIVSIPPLGPIAFALITKGFRGKLLEGLMIGTGAAIMDFIYAMIAFVGISLFISLLPLTVEKFYITNLHTIQIVLTFAACVIVIIYGIKIMRSKSSMEKMEAAQSGKLHFAEEKAKDIKEKAKDFTKQHNVPLKTKSNNGSLILMGILLTMSSITLPASWFAIVGYIKGFGTINSSFWGGFFFSLGAFAGTTLWFYTLLKLITSNKHRISPSTVNTLNIIAGYILIFLGAFLFIKAAYTLYS
jgi:threonine/homoserine/homoserine lactone efflux protein